MSEENKDNNFDNSIALWQREKKKQDIAGKKYPNYTGSLTVNGKKLNVSVWVNTDRKEGGQQPIMSGKIQEPMQKTTEEIPF